MTHSQHRNHMSDGTYPVDGCYWCYRFIVQPALVAKRGGYSKTSDTGRQVITLDDIDELAAQEAA